MMTMLDGSSELSAEEERQLGMAQLPREMSKHTGFSFDSPGLNPSLPCKRVCMLLPDHGTLQEVQA
jgi:hypothetical protein